MHDKILKEKLQYTSNGTVCDVYKGSTHHGGLRLSLKFDRPPHLPDAAVLYGTACSAFFQRHVRPVQQLVRVPYQLLCADRYDCDASDRLESSSYTLKS